MNKKQKNILYRIFASAALLIAAYLAPLAWQRLALLAASYILIGFDVLKKSFGNIFRGQVFDENFLMAIATVGAICIGEYGEAVFVMLFYQVGELFQGIAVGKSRKSVAALMEICPEYANVEIDGKLSQIAPEELSVGDVVIVRAGEKIPVDGTVLDGAATVNTANLTGEAAPAFVSEGDSVISGCVSLDGVLKIRVEKEFSDSTVCKILELVENASSAKTVTENFITKFAKYYTPAVVICAAAVAVIGPLFGGGFASWLHRALIFLVISCPCALVISVPLSFFGGIGCASRNGILIKGSNFIEALSKAQAAAFDKTGTLTKGTFRVSRIWAVGADKDEVSCVAAHAEAFGNHPIAVSVREAYGGEIDETRVSDIREIAGKGISVLLDGKRVLVGNAALMREANIEPEISECDGTAVFVAREGELLGCIEISDEIKPESERALRSLRSCGIEKLVMLTGDKREVGEKISGILGLDEVYCELLPSDKTKILEELLAKQEKGRTLIYVGDGVNDAPVLSRADIGIAMGAMGSDAAIEAADIVLMDDNPEKLPLAVKISRKTLKIVKQNIVFALAVKLLVLILGAFGVANMWEAVFADVGVSVIAILNAMRALKCRGGK